MKFGHKRADHYGWMKPQNWQAVLNDPASLEPEIKAAIEKENAYTQAFLDASADDAADLRKRLLEAQAYLNTEVGVVANGFFFFEKTSNSGETVVIRRNLTTGVENLLLDMGEERGENPVARLSWGGPKFSPNFQLLGWAVDETGSGSFVVKVREVDTGNMLVNHIADCHGAFTFDQFGQYLFWVGKDNKGRPTSVWRKNLADGSQVKCYETQDTSYFIDLQTSQSGEYIFIRRLNGDQSETLFIPSASPTDAPTVIEPLADFHDYEVEHWRDEFVIRTNADGAEDFKIMAAPVQSPGKAHWRELVPSISGRYIVDVMPFKDALVRTEWRDAKPSLVIMDAAGQEEEVVFEDAAYALTLTPRQDYASDFVSYQFSSPTTAPKLFKAAFCSAKSKPLFDSSSTSDFDASRFRLTRIDVVAEDGAKIPLTLLSLASSPPNPKQPVYMYAYGAYGEITEDLFRPEAIALVERGWTFAIAHVRGGGERGANWWRPTLKQGKKLTFSDFVACAQALVEQDLAAEGNIVAHGMSAGGLLMGAVFVTHPHLWAGVIAQVPFVDILNTLDDWQNHPLGSTPFAIWGDPRIEEDFKYMASYSPYDTLKPAYYPALLMTGGVVDDRVAFWEPLKFVAKARDMSESNRPLLSHIGMQSGHLGDPSPEGQLKQTLMFLQFALSVVSNP